VKSKIKTRAIILRTTKYSESSLVINAVSETHGTISILAKGIRKQPDAAVLQRLNELELVLYEPAETGMYLLAECALISKLAMMDDALNRAYAEAGAELVSCLITPSGDMAEVYRLLLTYLEYMNGVKQNGIAIFWRFMLRIMRELGVSLDLRQCGQCHGTETPLSGYEERHGFALCGKCLKNFYNVQPFSLQAKRLLFLLPEIGNHLDMLEIGESVAEEITGFLLGYLEHRFHKHFSLQSIHVALQLLRMDQKGSN